MSFGVIYACVIFNIMKIVMKYRNWPTIFFQQENELSMIKEIFRTKSRHIEFNIFIDYFLFKLELNSSNWSHYLNIGFDEGAKTKLSKVI